jgi:hypothetical protein
MVEDKAQADEKAQSRQGRDEHFEPACNKKFGHRMGF